MAQPTFGAVRQAVASYLTSSIGLRAITSRFGQINPPIAIIVPQTGSLIRYATTFDGETDYTIRAIIVVSESDSASGQDLLDGYLSPTGPNSVYAAVQADPTLGGQVSYCAVIEATGYGMMNINALDYMACSLTLNIGT